MARRLKLRTNELGTQELFLIDEASGEWEPEWKALQDHPIAKLFASVSKEDMDHALHGWTRPLVDKLGPAPALLLRKLPSSKCAHRNHCTLFRASICTPTHPKVPWCFQPEGTEGQTGLLASEAIRLWREGVYIVVVVDFLKST